MSLSDINECPAIEVFWHVFHAFKLESKQKLWDLQVASYAEQNKVGKANTLKIATDIGNVGTVRKKPWQRR